jgi:sulfur-oxidizing protein SoxX
MNIQNKLIYGIFKVNKSYILGGIDMQKLLRKLSVTVSTIAMVIVVGFSASVVAGDTDLEKGKKLAFDKKKGNCLACHMMTGGEMAGNIAPPLIAMKARFPDVKVLKAQIQDARVKNPSSFMPPFKPHGILTDAEIDKVTAFVHSL